MTDNSLIEKLEPLKHVYQDENCVDIIERVQAIVREHASAQGELVNDALRKCKAHLVTCGPFAGNSSAKLKQLGGVGRIETLDAVNAAIAAMNMGEPAKASSATIAPEVAETALLPFPAKHNEKAAEDIFGIKYEIPKSEPNLKSPTLFTNSKDEVKP